MINQRRSENLEMQTEMCGKEDAISRHTITRAKPTAGHTRQVSRGPQVDGGPKLSGGVLKIIMAIKFKIKAICGVVHKKLNKQPY